MDFILGAYPASPTLVDWDPNLESEFLNGLAAIPEITGLEIPWNGSLHVQDESWPLRHIPDRFQVVLTGVPAAVRARREDPLSGLASRDAEGRKRALSMALTIRDDTLRLIDARGEKSVLAVELHSAPLRRNGSSSALAESLAELADWDWGGASLLIEHCDAEVPGHQPQKGFLLLEEEIEAIESSETDIGIVLNWGRSAIELRNPDAVVRHVRTAQNARLLRAVVFSGVADRESSFGPAWIDAHLPVARSTEVPDGDSDSLMNETRIRAAIAEGPLDWVGAKLGYQPTHVLIEPRLRMIADSVRLIARIGAEVSSAAVPPHHP